jgi:hypothetical protein
MKTKIISILSASIFVALFALQVNSTSLTTESCKEIISISGSDGVDGICCPKLDKSCTNAHMTFADTQKVQRSFCP